MKRARNRWPSIWGKCNAHQFSTRKTYFSLDVFAFSHINASVEDVHRLLVFCSTFSNSISLKFFNSENVKRRGFMGTGVEQTWIFQWFRLNFVRSRGNTRNYPLWMVETKLIVFTEQRVPPNLHNIASSRGVAIKVECASRSPSLTSNRVPTAIWMHQMKTACAIKAMPSTNNE